MKIYVQEKDKLREFASEAPVVSVGRGKDNDLVIRDPRSSRHHCRILETPQGYFLEDLDSRNGTTYEGQKVGKVEVEPGTPFRIGHTLFFVEKRPEEPVHDDRETRAKAKPAAARAGEGEDGRKTAEPHSLTSQDAYLEGIKGPNAGKRIPLTKLPYTVGRRSDNDFRVEDQRCSGHHLRLLHRDGVFHVEDLDSRNGTFIDGRRIEGEAVLPPGSRLQFGESQYRVHLPGAAEAAGVEAPADYEFSRFNVEEFLQTHRSGHPLVAVGLVAVLGALLYFSVQIALGILARRDIDPVTAGNYVAENWSFEEPALETGGIPAWSAAGEAPARLEITQAQGVQYPGRRALSVVSTGSGEELARAVYKDLISVSGKTRYHFSANVLNRGALAAGVLVRWLRPGVEGGHEELARTYTPAVIYDGDEARLRRSAMSPDNASLAEVSCFVLGGSAVFDRVYFSLRPFDDEAGADSEGETPPIDPAAPEVAGGEGAFDDANPIELVARVRGSATSSDPTPPVRGELLANGTLVSLRRQTLPRVLALWPGLPPERDPLRIGPRLAAEPAPSTSAGTYRLSAQLPDVTTGRWQPMEIHAQLSGTRILCRHRYRKLTGLELPETVAVYLELADREPIWTVFDAEGIVDLAPDGSTVSGVRELVIGRGTEQVVFQFAPPMALQALPAKHGGGNFTILATAATASLPRNQVEVAIAKSSGSEESAVRALIQEAQRLYSAGELSRAEELLRSVKFSYPWRRDDVRRAESLLQNWSEAGESTLKNLREDFAILQKTHAVLAYENLMAQCDEALKRFRGTAAAEAIARERERFDAYWKNYQSQSAQRELDAVLARANELYTEAKFHLAEFYYRDVLTSARDPEVLKQVEHRLSLIEQKKKGLARTRT